MIILCFCLQFTWAKSFDARLWHSCITLTRGSSIQLFLLFKPVFFSQAISTRCRTISMFPVTPFTINWKIFWVVNCLAMSYRTVWFKELKLKSYWTSFTWAFLYIAAFLDRSWARAFVTPMLSCNLFCSRIHPCSTSTWFRAFADYPFIPFTMDYITNQGIAKNSVM